MENKRLIKALSEKMYLLSATQKSSEEWTFKVRGQTNNVYEQKLFPSEYSCSCPDHQGKKTFCKHLLFLTVRVGKQYELGAELAQRPKTTWKNNAFQACSTSWVACLSHLIVSSHTTCPVITPETDGICGICYEDLVSESGSDSLVECFTTCHKHYHKLCIDKWLEHGSTCPNCRSEWVNKSEAEFIGLDTSISLDLPLPTIEGSILGNPGIIENIGSIDITNTNTNTNTNTTNENTSINKNTVNNTDIVISFDTTGSMYPCLAEVRRNVTSMTERLFREIPSLRVAIIAHGDYCDNDKVLTQLDFTTDQSKIKKFIEDAPSTYGGDYPECYELVLQTTKSLSWRLDATMKSLILIGDAPPHEKNENPTKIDWRFEAECLKNRNIQVFSVQCLNSGNSEAFNFYSEVSEITNGYHVFLDQFSYIKDMIQAICFKQYDQDRLEKFEEEVQKGTGGMSQAMRLMFDTMLGKKTREQVREEMNPARFRERYFSSSRTSSGSTSSGHRYCGGSTSAAPSLEREAELRPSPPSRFQVFNVDEDINIKDFCNKMGITFKTGRGFYEFIKPEIIQKKKEIILMDKVTKELYEGEAARSIAGIGPNEENARIKPGKLEKYRMFIQSTSVNRKLIGGNGFLYEVV